MAIFCTDAGHGGTDSGAVWNGVLEKDINLRVVLRLNKFLKDRGHKVWTTRRSDERVPPLKTRCRLINAHHSQKRPRFDAIISIHCNVAAKLDEAGGKYIPVPECRGLYAIYGAESQSGTNLANTIAESCAKKGIVLAHHGILSTLQLGRSLAWIHQTLPTAVLVELGFLTNPDELQLLQTPEYRQTLVEAIAEGLERFAQPVA
ncbi:MAG: N-acetylmuramoyl-L-alanine amidase [Calditrichaeota bacterium]|nr:N-acetylmuramoyl-L-alanine amidase [Calditrichota bacterium]